MLQTVVHSYLGSEQKEINPTSIDAEAKPRLSIRCKRDSLGKDPDAGERWKGKREGGFLPVDEGYHNNGHEFKQTEEVKEQGKDAGSRGPAKDRTAN